MAPASASFALMEIDHTGVERRLLNAALHPGAVALDAGCGRTTRLRNYRDRIVRLVGVDSDEEAGRENPYLDEFVSSNLDEPLPFAEDTFDLVYANFVVEHLGEPERTFLEWRRVLRTGGQLVVVTSNRSNPAMAVGDRLPQRVRLSIKRRGAGAEERNVYPARYLANTPQQLRSVAEFAGFEPVSIEFVGTLHRYGVRVPGLGWLLRTAEQVLPRERRSTIVASFR
jgi:SAM-dependent methyltransferase